MDYRRFGSTIVLRVDRGEKLLEKLLEVAEREDIGLAVIEGLGSADRLSVCLYDVEKQQFIPHEFEGTMEITSITGSVTRMNGRPYLHVHISAADTESNVVGGHLKEARIYGTAELFITVLDGEVGRKKDDITGTGLNLFDFD